MMSRIRTALGVAALAGLTVAAAGCKEPLLPESAFEVVVDTMRLYAFNGSARTVPSAIGLSTRQAVPLSTEFGFDIAFDINAEGRAVIYPVQLLVTGLPSRTGVRVMPGITFDGIEKAPQSDYVYDRPTIVSAGEVVVIQTADSRCSPFQPIIYAKLAMDSIIVAERRMRMRVATNPNCGYISLRPGRSRE